ncbi:hypothetical protein NQ176_g8646 [Zarea fungicola]|uniref:Uncharacterized protein n=1 Tax=Zarea fungicola TaxID=93591 RepID=A0ACC1MR72_9HYPO|nr:hypothetical protein NQ176_g8646 [Lecanicillium fungicola]
MPPTLRKRKAPEPVPAPAPKKAAASKPKKAAAPKKETVAKAETAAPAAGVAEAEEASVTAPTKTASKQIAVGDASGRGLQAGRE